MSELFLFDQNPPEEQHPKLESFDGYKRAAYKAKENHDDVALAAALKGMLDSATTEEETLKIIDYIKVPGSAFEQLVQKKRMEIKEKNKNRSSTDYAA